MRSWHTLVLAVSLVACGGIVSDPSGPSTGSDQPGSGSDTPTSSGGSSGSGARPTPTATATTTPAPLPTPTPSIFAGATGFDVKGATLGAAPGFSRERSYRFEPAPKSVTLVTEDAEQELELTPAEAGKLGDLLATVRPIAMPSSCVFDGPAAALVVSRSGTQTTYHPQDYNCMHRTDVSYASGVESVLAFLDSVRASR